jgi:hypothetical protein
MDWMNEMGEMIAVDAPERETYYEQMIDAQERAIIEACPCEMAGTIEAADALLSGSCRSCGWNA